MKRIYHDNIIYMYVCTYKYYFLSGFFFFYLYYLILIFYIPANVVQRNNIKGYENCKSECNIISLHIMCKKGQNHISF